MDSKEPVNPGAANEPAEAVVSLDPLSGGAVVDAVEGAMGDAKDALSRNPGFNKNFGAVPASGGSDSLNLPDSLITPEPAATTVPPPMVPTTTTPVEELLPNLDRPTYEDTTPASETTATTLPPMPQTTTTTTTIPPTTSAAP